MKTGLPFEDNDKNFQLIAKNPLIGIIITSSHGKLIYANDAFCKMLDYTLEEIKNIHFLEITHPDDRQGNQKMVEQIIRNKSDSFQVEKRYITKSKETIWCEVCINSSRSETGEFEYFTGIVTNIDQRKKAEQTLRESEERYRRLAENFPNGVVNVYDRNLKLLFVYGQELKQSSTRAEDYIGKTFQELAPPETFEIAEPHLKAAFEGKTSSYETPFYNNTYYLVNVAPLYGTDGKIDQIMLISQNLTDRKLAEQALKESEKFLQKAQTMAHVGFLKYSSETRTITGSEELLRIFGFKKETILPSDFLNTVRADQREFVTSALQKCIVEKKSYDIEHYLELKDGTTKYVKSIGEIVPGNKENQFVIIGTVQDITDRKRWEEELVKAKEKAEESDRLKSAFLANMSHEIRTPMNAIKGFAELLDQPDLTEDKKRNFISIINQRTNDLLTLINDLLDIAKIESGQLSLIERPGSINILFNEVLQIYKSQKNNPEVEVKLELAENIGTFSTDFFRLNQVLINLINNALKFTASGYVLLGCRFNNPEELLFYVKDTGIGIPADKLQLIFEPFRQIDESYLSRQTSGAGLGLSIVKGLVELMNGKIWIESQPGQGSVFYFTVPYKPAEIKIEKPKSKKLTVYDWNGKSILIVEDELYNAELMIELLAKTKARISHAANGQEAIDAIQQDNTIDVILMDIRLPDIQGYELVKRLKKINPKLYIIAQTAYATGSDKKKAFESGFDQYISKPIDRNKLFDLIHQHFSHL